MNAFLSTSKMKYQDPNIYLLFFVQHLKYNIWTDRQENQSTVSITSNVFKCGKFYGHVPINSIFFFYLPPETV